ncbi:MAG: phospho-N-acetylmuramoyl-pentapeptide-transferase [Clostridia bacterium]|nr:phospho-N-acetylmuramoyl-pentapeptide-transferase [Clostridia bacterium]
MKTAIISFAISFVLTVILGKFLIPVLKSIKMGQKILDIGPRWHKSKEGTPTMGGIFFAGGVTAALVVFAVMAIRGGESISELVINFIFVLLCGLTGFIDDFAKFVHKQNKGLTAIQKLILQFASAAAYVFAVNAGKVSDTSVALPFTESRLELGIFYYVLLITGIVFTVNSVNLTDGIDGLAASVTTVACVFLGAVCFRTENMAALALAAAVCGGCLGFLVYNFYPAKVFMGDTGSLFLGGVVSCIAVWLDMPLILVFVGIIYYAEAISVVLQVASFKLFKKRIFKMSPIHHHFEMCGWNEIKIVGVFSFVTLVFSAIGSYGFLIA